MTQRPPDDVDALFAAARTEVPSQLAKAKAMSALGLGASATAAVGASAVAATSTGATAATGFIVKGVLVAALMAGSFGAGVVAERRRSTAQAPAPTPVAPAVAPAPAVQVETPLPEIPTAAAPTASPEVPPLPSPKPVVARPRSAEPSGDVDALSLELQALDRARTLLASGQAARALIELESYQRRFPSGALATEAGLVKLEALLKAGRRSEAENLRRRFAQEPSELVRQRVQRIFDAN